MSEGEREGARSRAAFCVSALVGMFGVMLGAFGAHGLEGMLEARGKAEVWDTAVFYHLVHAVVLLVVAREGDGVKGSWWCLLAGIVLFSGSLYVLALTGIGWLGMMAAVGGSLLILGWLWLCFERAG